MRCAVCCVLCVVCCVLCAVCCLLCAVCCVLCVVCCVLCAVSCVMCAVCCVLCVVCCVLCVVCCVLCAVCCVLCAVFCVLCAVYFVLVLMLPLPYNPTLTTIHVCTELSLTTIELFFYKLPKDLHNSQLSPLPHFIMGISAHFHALVSDNTGSCWQLLEIRTERSRNGRYFALLWN